MRRSIETMIIQETQVELRFYYEKNQKPVIESNHAQYDSSADLLKDIAFSIDNCLDKLAQAITFLSFGKAFTLIEDIHAFKEDYQKQLALEGLHLGFYSNRLTDSCEYDLSVLDTPRIKDDHLIFFVKNVDDNRPYQVAIKILIKDNRAYLDHNEKPTYKLLQPLVRC